MSKRLQVLLDEREHRRIQRIARRRGLTVAEWVRQVLRQAATQEPEIDAERKLAVVRRAADHAFPTADIGDMLAEIEAGYTTPPT